MGAHPDALAAIIDRLTRASDRAVIDELLDQWFDVQYRATEWDAGHWGFDPDRWMEAERAALAGRPRVGRPWPWSRPSHT